MDIGPIQGRVHVMPAGLIHTMLRIHLHAKPVHRVRGVFNVQLAILVVISIRVQKGSVCILAQMGTGQTQIQAFANLAGVVPFNRILAQHVPMLRVSIV